MDTDILCLQEVQGENLKRKLQFNTYPDQSQHQWFGEYLALKNSYGANARYKHGHHGNAVLSKHKLDPKHNLNISVNRLEQRGVLHCQIQPDNCSTPIVVLNAHLNLLHKDRIKQYDAIVEYVNDAIDCHQPLILAGDFNDWRCLSTRRLKCLGVTEVFEHLYHKSPKTFPAKWPLLSLDRIYVKNLRILDAVVHAGIPWSTLSDHLPISASVALP